MQYPIIEKVNYFIMLFRTCGTSFLVDDPLVIHRELVVHLLLYPYVCMCVYIFVYIVTLIPIFLCIYNTHINLNYEIHR